jgi:hypothetical protein
VKLARLRKPKAAVFPHTWNIDLIPTQQYYKKQVVVRMSLMREGWQKKEVKKVNMVDTPIVECLNLLKSPYEGD